MFTKVFLKTVVFVFFGMGAYSFCAAQQAGTRDVTENWRAPEDHLLAPPAEICPEIKSTIEEPQSATPKSQPDDHTLMLTISDVVPHQLHPGEDFTATVQLKNIGTAAIRVPWQPDGERVTRASSDGSEEKYEVADVNFRVLPGKQGSLPVYLESYGALFAYPENRDSYMELQPGHWVNIRFKGTVTCGLPECSIEIKPDEHAKLTAIWYQRVLTHSIQECNEKHSSLLIRQLDSAPLPVVIQRTDANSGTPAKK